MSAAPKVEPDADTDIQDARSGPSPSQAGANAQSDRALLDALAKAVASTPAFAVGRAAGIDEAWRAVDRTRHLSQSPLILDALAAIRALAEAKVDPVAFAPAWDGDEAEGLFRAGMVMGETVLRLTAELATMTKECNAALAQAESAEIALGALHMIRRDKVSA